MRAFLEPGEAILNCPPTFGMYAFDAEINRARLISVPRNGDFSLDMDAMERIIPSERPKLAFIASPNNPDGSLLAEEAFERLLSYPIMVILDEAYIEFAPPEASRMRAVLSHPNLVVLRTFSKWAGLAGLRVGYGIFPSWLTPHLWKIKQPYNVSVAASAAAIASLRHADRLEEIRQRLLAERERLNAALQAIPWLHPYPSQANFILCRVTSLSAKAVTQALAQAGILVRYFDKAGLQDHIRISVGKPEHTDALITELRRLSAAEDLKDFMGRG
jgi:histidinol-phosphate aminotransferase